MGERSHICWDDERSLSVEMMGNRISVGMMGDRYLLG